MDMSTEQNGSGITPMGYRVLVKPVEVESKTKGGLYLPDERVEKDSFARMNGRIVAMSDAAFNYDSDVSKPMLGDLVMFARYENNEVRGRDGETYWLINDQSIMAVLDEE
jgi:Co-chaperonin GroES (HSP10)